MRFLSARFLLLVTCMVALIGGVSLYLLGESPHGTKRVTIPTGGQIILGNPEAAVNVLVFEDLYCPFCREFFLKTFPLIQKEYIDSGKISYTIISITFLDSREITTAAHCLYSINKNSYIPFIQAYYEKSFRETLPIQIDNLVDSVGGVNRAAFEKCRTATMRDVHFFDNNYDLAKEKMRNHVVVTPTLFINGIQQRSLSFDSLSKAINSALKEQEAPK